MGRLTLLGPEDKERGRLGEGETWRGGDLENGRRGMVEKIWIGEVGNSW
jgi:hypothetical protein